MCDDDRIPTREEHEKSEADDWVTEEREKGNWPPAKELDLSIRSAFKAGASAAIQCVKLMHPRVRCSDSELDAFLAEFLDSTEEHETKIGLRKP